MLRIICGDIFHDFWLQSTNFLLFDTGFRELVASFLRRKCFRGRFQVSCDSAIVL